MAKKTPEPRLADFSEIGSTGLNRFGGNIYEEFLPQLRWPRAAGVYKEMASNDPTIGAILFVYDQLIRRTTWRVEAGGTDRVDQEAADFLTSCMDDMDQTWVATITEILSYFVYGWSWHEILFKKRDTSNSKYPDGLIGWAGLAGRSQESWHEWLWDDKGKLNGMCQLPAPDFQIRELPYAKSMLFRTRADRGNPEGKSMLRNAYRPWYFKKHIEEIEGVGIERDLAGLPVLKPPESVDLWNANDTEAVKLRNHAERLVRNIRRDKNEGIVLPFGWELNLLSTGSRRQFDTNAILNRYDQRIAITMLADIVLLGADKVGSFALADVKKSLMGAALEAQVNSIADEINKQGVPLLMKFNSRFANLKKYPRIQAGEVETPSLTELARYITALSGAKMPLFPNADLENFLRQVASLPKRPEGLPDTPHVWDPTQSGASPDDSTTGKGVSGDGRIGNGADSLVE